MNTFNMHEAKSQLSRLVERVESGMETEIIIARNGRPAARLVPVQDAEKKPRIGIARGRFTVPETIDQFSDEILKQFLGPNM